MNARLAIGALLLGAGACSLGERPPGPPLKLAIAEARQPAFALLYVAEANGYLREAGLDVSFTSFRLGRDALASVIEGRADLATVYETPVVARLCEGDDLGILTALHSSTRNNALVVRTDRGIAGPADLEGKRIGLSLGTHREYLLSVILVTEGLTADSVRRVDIAPADYEKSMLAGTVDGVVTMNPLALRRLLGDRAAVFHSDAYTETSMLAGLRATLAGKPEAMRRLAAALVRAQDSAQRDKEGAIRIVAARLAGEFDETAVREHWDNLGLEARLGNVLVSTMALQAQWMKETGRCQRSQPDFPGAVFTEYLRAARPEAVTVHFGRAREGG